MSTVIEYRDHDTLAVVSASIASQLKASLKREIVDGILKKEYVYIRGNVSEVHWLLESGELETEIVSQLTTEAAEMIDLDVSISVGIFEVLMYSNGWSKKTTRYYLNEQLDDGVIEVIDNQGRVRCEQDMVAGTTQIDLKSTIKMYYHTDVESPHLLDFYYNDQGGMSYADYLPGTMERETIETLEDAFSKVLFNPNIPEFYVNAAAEVE